MLPDSRHGGTHALLSVCLAGEDVVDVLECVVIEPVEDVHAGVKVQFCHVKCLLDLIAVRLPATQDAFRPGAAGSSSGGEKGKSGNPAGGSCLPPCRVAGEIRKQMLASGFKLRADEAQPQEPAPEGVLGVIRL